VTQIKTDGWSTDPHIIIGWEVGKSGTVAGAKPLAYDKQVGEHSQSEPEKTDPQFARKHMCTLGTGLEVAAHHVADWAV
jgi:hypothetical protein